MASFVPLLIFLLLHTNIHKYLIKMALPEQTQHAPPTELAREMSTNTLIKTEQQLREEIAALKREEENLKRIDEQIKQNLEIVHEKRTAAEDHDA